MSRQKNKGDKPPLKNHVVFSEHIRAFVNALSEQQQQKKEIVQAYLNKRDRPVSMVELPVYNFSKYTLIGLHLISFLFASSFVFYLQTLPISQGIIYILSFVCIAILGFCEFGQHSTLNTFFNIRFISGLTSTRLLILSGVFSLISVTSSTFGVSNFFESRNIESSALWLALLSISVITEFFIVMNTYDVHRFETRAKNEVLMLNDLTYNEGQRTIFVDQPPTLTGTQPTPTLTVAQQPEQEVKEPQQQPKEQPEQEAKEQQPQQQPEIIIQRPKRRRTAAAAVIPDPLAKPLVLSDKNTKSIRAIKNTPKEQQSQTVGKEQPKKVFKPVGTPKEHQKKKDGLTVTGWDETRAKDSLRVYTKRVKKNTDKGEKPTPEQLTGKAFFSTMLDTHNFEKGNFPYVAPKDRKDYFTTSKTAAK